MIISHWRTVVSLREANESLKERIAELEAALRDGKCPRPLSDNVDESVGYCVDQAASAAWRRSQEDVIDLTDKLVKCQHRILELQDLLATSERRVKVLQDMRNPAKGRLVHGVGKDGSTPSGGAANG